ncbi:MAG: FG-GAP repeat domain-containing protein [Rhodospirillaceae bacterium]
MNSVSAYARAYAVVIAVASVFATTSALACAPPPHLSSAFHAESFVALPGCDGPNLPGCTATGVSAAWYDQPTERYRHAVLGDAIEGGGLSAYTNQTASDCAVRSVTLDAAHVFEDVAPRLADLDGDGRMEIVTVRSHRDQGAQLAIWGTAPDADSLMLIAATPYIGRTNRWLAPAGIGDLDGDGFVEIAYVDRPHLAKILRVWRFRDGGLEEVTSLNNVTNHRIGERDIAGGLRDCGDGPEIILADAGWDDLLAVRLEDDRLTPRPIAPHQGRESFRQALGCAF